MRKTGVDHLIEKYKEIEAYKAKLLRDSIDGMPEGEIKAEIIKRDYTLPKSIYCHPNEYHYLSVLDSLGIKVIQHSFVESGSMIWNWKDNLSISSTEILSIY